MECIYDIYLLIHKLQAFGQIFDRIDFQGFIDKLKVFADVLEDIYQVFRILGYIFFPISLIIDLLLAVIDCSPNDDGDLVDCVLGEIDLPFPDFSAILKSFGFDLDKFIEDIVAKFIRPIEINLPGLPALWEGIFDEWVAKVEASLARVNELRKYLSIKSLLPESIRTDAENCLRYGNFTSCNSLRANGYGSYVDRRRRRRLSDSSCDDQEAYQIQEFTDLTYPPFANFTACSNATYPVVLSATFKSRNCQIDFTRYLRFPCNGARCSRNLRNLTVDCDGMTTDEYAMATDMDDTVMHANYFCIPNNVQLSTIGELITFPLNIGSPAFDDGARWSTGIQRQRKGFSPSYDTNLECTRSQVLFIEYTSAFSDPCYDFNWRDAGGDASKKAYRTDYCGWAYQGYSYNQWRPLSTCEFYARTPSPSFPNDGSIDCGATQAGIKDNANKVATTDCTSATTRSKYNTCQTSGLCAGLDDCCSGGIIHGCWGNGIKCCKGSSTFFTPCDQYCGVAKREAGCYALALTGASCKWYAGGIQTCDPCGGWPAATSGGSTVSADDYISRINTELAAKANVQSSYSRNTVCPANIKKACDGKERCSFAGCTPPKLQFACTTGLNATTNISAVVLAFAESLNPIKEATCTPPMLVEIETSSAQSSPFFTYNVQPSDYTCTASKCTIKPVQISAKLLGAATPPNALTIRVQYRCLCPAGYRLLPKAFNNFSTCTRCEDGYYRTADMRDCQTCPLGKYSNADRSACVDCPAGTFNRLQAQNITGCLRCPCGTTSSAGATECQLCLKQWPNTYSNEARTACIECPAGYFARSYQIDPAVDPELAAINGFNASDPDAVFFDDILADVPTYHCSLSPTGTYRGPGEVQCRDSPVGYYLYPLNFSAPDAAANSTDTYDRLNLTAGGRRNLRSLGRRQLEELFILPCLERVNRRLQEQGGVDGEVGCDVDSKLTPYALAPCPLGFYSPTRGALACAPCPRGSYADQLGSTACKSCPRGLITNDSASTSRSNCTTQRVSRVDYSLYPDDGSLNCTEMMDQYGLNLTENVIGDGFCNQGAANTAACNYDGGDRCAQTCVPVDLDARDNETSIGEPLFYDKACAPWSFQCRNPNVTLSLLCDGNGTASSNDTLLGGACPSSGWARLGNGYCDNDLNYLECNYDLGDCCASSCVFNNTFFDSCSKLDCRDPKDSDPLQAYVNPQSAFFDCSAISNLSQILADVRTNTFTTAISPCQRAAVNVTRQLDLPVPPELCDPSSSTTVYSRFWSLTPTDPGAIRRQRRLSSGTPVPNTELQQNLYFYQNVTTLEPLCVIVDPSSYPSYGYGFGWLLTSPDLGVPPSSTNATCTSSQRVAFAECVGGVGSEGTCVYDNQDDELYFSSMPAVNSTYAFKLGLLDGCDHLEVYRRDIVILSPSSAGAGCVDTRPLPGGQVLGERLAAEDVGSRTGLVCTQVVVTRTRQNNTFQVTVGVNDQYPGCVSSATDGELTHVFFNLAPFNDSNATVASGSIRLGPQLVPNETVAANATDILTALTLIFRRGYKLQVPQRWQGSGVARLGSFYITTATGAFEPGTTGWLTGFYYQRLLYGRVSAMAGLVNKQPVANFTAPNGSSNLVSTQIASRTSTLNGVVCTRVTARRLDIRKAEVCLAVTNAGAQCSSSASSGRLTGIYLSSFFFNVTPEFLLFENGTLQVQTDPQCYLPYNEEVDGASVETCISSAITGITSFEYSWDFSATASVSFTSANQDLGCFYVTNILAMEPLSDGWDVGLTFDSLPGGAVARMADPVFAITDQGAFTPRNCTFDTVMARVSLGDGGVGGNQVCTRVEVGYDGGVSNRLCLTVTDQYPGCQNSAQQGSLQAIFLALDPFVLRSPYSFALRGDDSLPRNFPICRDRAGALSRCYDADLTERGDNGYSLGATFAPEANTSWSGPGEHFLGCVVFKDSPYFRPETYGPWTIGLQFANTTPGLQSARMTGRICGPPLPPIDVTTLNYSYISVQVPQGEGDRVGQFGRVCARVSLEQLNYEAVKVCVAVTQGGPNPACLTSSSTGRLSGVFFSQSIFGTDASELNVEDGDIAATRPYCAGLGGNLTCLSADIRGVGVRTPSLDFGFSVAGNLTFTSGEANLGCFFITDVESLVLGSEGWDVGLTFEGLEGNKSARMATTLLAPPKLLDAECAYNVVNARMPLPAPDPTADLVCTRIDITPVDTQQLRVCLSPTDQWHGCQYSSSQGKLEAVFLRLDGLGVNEPQQVIVSGSDSMSINYPYCVKQQGGPGVSSCQGFIMSTPVVDYGWDIAFAVSSAGSNTSWSGTPSATLGCFYLSGLSSFDVALNGWTVGLKYSNTTKGSASMVKAICSDLVPFNSTVREFNQISTQVLVGDDDVQGRTSRVCTKLEVEQVDPGTVQICLSTTNGPSRVCGLSSPQGSLSGIFFDAQTFGRLPAELGIEDGSIRFQRSCFNGAEVTSCGAAFIDAFDATYGFTYAGEVASGGAWSNNQTASLGCFYITGPRAILPPALGWNVGVAYQNTGLQGDLRSVMSRPIFTPAYPQLGTSSETIEYTAGCDFNTINVRMPLADSAGSTCQVCSSIRVTQVDFQLMEVCLTSNNTYPSCASSASSALLESVFISANTFERFPVNLDFQPTTTMAIKWPYCASDVNSSLAQCDDVEIQGLYGGSLNMAFSLAQPNPLASLGCFLISGSSTFLPSSSNGWPIGTSYTSASCDRFLKTSRMVNQICRPTNASDFAFTSQYLANQLVNQQLFVGEDDRNGRTRRVCTRVTVTRIDPFTAKVSLGLTSSDPLCVATASQGRLRAVFLNGSFFGVPDSNLLHLEDGTIRFDRAYCTSADGYLLDDCRGLSARGLPQPYVTLGATVRNNVTWAGANNVAFLGDFYVTGISELQGTGRQDPLKRRLLQDSPLSSLQVVLRFDHVDVSAPQSYSLMGGVLFAPPLPLPPAPPGSAAGRLCEQDVVLTRQPLGDSQGTSSQVCTAFNVTAVAPSTYQVCLATTSSKPGCAFSSSQGTLRGVFMDTVPFGVPADQLIVLDSTIENDGYCIAAHGQALESCRGVNVTGLTRPGFTLGFPVRNNVSWSGSRSNALGCFLLGGAAGFQVGPQGWAVGAVYSNTEGGRSSRMVQALCKPVSAVAPATCVTSKVLRKGFAVGRVADTTIPPLPTYLRVNITLTRTENTTIRVCLMQSEKRSLRRDRGTISAIYFRSTDLGVSNPRLLNIESGELVIKQPVCVASSPAGPPVNQCGDVSTAVAKPTAKTGFDVGFEIAQGRWTNGSLSLGCFYLTHTNGFKPSGTTGWPVALRFNEIGPLTRAVSYATQTRQRYSIVIGRAFNSFDKCVKRSS